MGKNTVKNRTSFYKKRFLEKFVEYCVVGHAARAAGIRRCTVYNWLKEKEFAAEFEDARKEVLEKLEQEAIRRATKGISKPVFYKGEECGIIQEYSDTLLIVLLKANAPEKYRERYELTGKDGGPIKHEAIASFKFVMPDGLEKTAQEMANGNTDRRKD